MTSTRTRISSRSHGSRIETEALEYFNQRRRIRVLALNYARRTGEIDLILEEERGGRVELVFVEVRARENGALQSGIESVGLAKRLKLVRTARQFLVRYKGPASAIRFDILDWDGRGWAHLENAIIA